MCHYGQFVRNGRVVKLPYLQYRTWKATSAQNNLPKKCQKNYKSIKYFVEINKNEVNKNRRQKNKRQRLATSKNHYQLLIAKFLIIIFESVDHPFLNFY